MPRRWRVATPAVTTTTSPSLSSGPDQSATFDSLELPVPVLGHGIEAEGPTVAPIVPGGPGKRTSPTVRDRAAFAAYALARSWGTHSGMPVDDQPIRHPIRKVDSFHDVEVDGAGRAIPVDAKSSGGWRRAESSGADDEDPRMSSAAAVGPVSLGTQRCESDGGPPRGPARVRRAAATGVVMASSSLVRASAWMPGRARAAGCGPRAAPLGPRGRRGASRWPSLAGSGRG